MNEEVRISLLEQNMKELKDSMSSIQADLKALSKQVDNILTTKIMDHSHMESEIAVSKEAIEELKKKDNLWRWLSPTLSAILSAVVTFLVINYLQHPH